MEEGAGRGMRVSKLSIQCRSKGVLWTGTHHAGLMYSTWFGWG